MSEDSNVVPIETPQLIATKVCEDEFTRFVETMELDVDPKGMSDDDKDSYVNAHRVIITAMEKGHLVINENGEPVYTPSIGKVREPITFHEPEGSAWIAMDGKKKDHDVGKVHATMADLTHMAPVRFAKMKGRDLKVCHAITGLFLA